MGKTDTKQVIAADYILGGIYRRGLSSLGVLGVGKLMEEEGPDTQREE